MSEGPLSRADVEHVAELARLALEESELAALEEQLNHILERFAVLSELDTDGIDPTAQVIEPDGDLREDRIRPSLASDEALANAPERSADHILVPVVVDEARRS